MKFKILALIPTYNEEKHIQRVLEKLLSYFNSSDILVVNDGSTDHTEKIVQALGVNLVTHKKNLGKGESLKTGFSYAVQHSYQAVLTLDGDGQHDPDEAPKFIEKLKEGADLVIGSRFPNLKMMPKDRYLSNRLTTLVLSIITTKHLEDTQSGFRLIKTSVLNSISLQTNFFALESELILKTVKKNFKIAVVPVSLIYNKEDTSKINRFVDTIRFMAMVIRYLIWK